MVIDWEDDYAACANGSGWWQEPTRGTFDMTGQDRARMLQGFCTADIEKLDSQSGTEAFVLNPKGKVLGFVRVYNLDDRIWIDSDHSDVAPLIQHLDRYVIREDVQFLDRTDQRSNFVVAGPQTQACLERLFLQDLPEEELQTATFDFQGQPIRIACLNEFEMVAYRIDIPSDFSETMRGLLAEELPGFNPRLAETLRIEFGTPKSGVDVTEENLPQEVQRDQQAISFTKGCYLGQETVARIDALGHVNRLLVGVRFESGAEVAPELELSVDDKVVGHTTSVAYSLRLQSPLAMAYVKRAQAKPGTELSSSSGTGTVVSLPADDEEEFDD